MLYLNSVHAKPHVSPHRTRCGWAVLTHAWRRPRRSHRLPLCCAVWAASMAASMLRASLWCLVDPRVSSLNLLRVGFAVQQAVQLGRVGHLDLDQPADVMWPLVHLHACSPTAASMCAAPRQRAAFWHVVQCMYTLPRRPLPQQGGA